MFGRYTRDECGLPPVETARERRRRVFARWAAVFLSLAVVGWLAGVGVARWRSAQVMSLHQRIARAELSQIPALLSRGRLFAASRAGDGRTTFALATATLAAADRMPRRLGYYGNVGRILADVDLTDQPDLAFLADLTRAGVLIELERYGEAFHHVDVAESTLAALPDGPAKRMFRLQMVNLRAYLLARAPVSVGGNPEKSLHLAQLLLLSRDEVADGVYPSDAAAFLDTLACAWHAAGESEQAVETQAMALGLAEPEHLEVYLRHYDEFAQAARKAINTTVVYRSTMSFR